MSDDNIPNRLRDWLARTLTETEMSQAALARAMGVSSSAMSRILKGERQISVEELTDALKFFGRESEVMDLLSLNYVYRKVRTIQIDISKNGATEVSNKLVEGEGLVKEPYAAASDDPFDLTIDIRSYGESSAKLGIPRICLGIFFSIENLRWMMVGDDAMSPTIERSDIVVFDLRNRMPGFSGLTVIEDGFGGAIVRRVDFKDFEGGDSATINVISDNPRYPLKPMRVSAIRLLGRCIGIYKHAF